MTLSTPAVRSALICVVVAALVVAAGVAVHLASRARDAATANRDVLGAHAVATAEALAAQAGGPPSPETIADAFGPFAALGDGVERVLVDDAGRVYGSSDADFARAVDWGTALRRAAPPSDVALGTARYALAIAPVGATGLSVAAARRADRGIPLPALLKTLAWAFALWSLLAGVLAARGWADGPRTAARLTAFGEQVARGDATPAAMRDASRGLGTLAGAFAPVAARIRREATDRAEQREHVAALYQVNPHYVLLCTLDGRIVEANPAFYAATGMPPEVIRDGRAEALEEVFPLGPLFDLARRSLAEGAAIGGVDYGIVDANDAARPVEVSLKAFRAGGADAVVIQATDVAARRRLESRVEAFTDTLELMVDQRTAQLTAGQQSLRRILDAAGVVVASFDGAGATRRWSGGAHALTGRAIGDVPTFAAATAALGMTDADRAAFTAWFWNPGDGPHLARHLVGGSTGGRDAADGWPLREMRVVWHKVDADVPGRTDARTLVGAPVPAVADLRTGAPADTAAFVGDGLAGEVPSPS